MLKTKSMKTKLPSFFFLLLCIEGSAQCVTPPVHASCTGTEQMPVANETIGTNQSRWYYGPPVSLANVRLNGGTLVVCSELTLTDFVLDSGRIFVEPDATLTVSNGAGLILNGNAGIYNEGTVRCMGNLVLNNSYVSAAAPNVFMNVSAASVLDMQNQYFVINNPYSKFVNMGKASIHGLITDPGSAAGCVCLGNHSRTMMTVLYNKAKFPYIVPSGSACVSVTQFSQFYDTLTNYPSLNVCLGATHYTDVSCLPWGCKTNGWGAAQTVAGCTSCLSTLVFLSVGFQHTSVVVHGSYNEISWNVEGVASGSVFRIQRSVDGKQFQTISSMTAGLQGGYNWKDSDPLRTSCYYRVSLEQEGRTVTSPVVPATRKNGEAFVFPNPFTDRFNLFLPEGEPSTLLIMDMTGRRVCFHVRPAGDHLLEISMEGLPSGPYVLQFSIEGKKYSKQVYRQ